MWCDEQISALLAGKKIIVKAEWLKNGLRTEKFKNTANLGLLSHIEV
jgi:hypothetical protein